MKKALRLKSALLLALMIMSLSVFTTACNKDSNSDSEPKSDSGSTEKISGTIVVSGSSALQPLVDEAAKKYSSKNSDAKISVQGGGSGTGLSQVFQGAVDIGNSDIFADEKLKAEEAKQLVDHQVCVVGIAAVVNPGVKVDNLTKQQLIDVFTGKTKNWKDVGGDDMNIVLINRPSSSGTRATFKKYALNGAEEAEGVALTQDQSGTVKKTVTDTAGSIAYLAFSYLDDTTKALKLDGIEPTSENVANGKYPVWAYEHMYTKGEATGLAKAFLDYMVSDDVQKDIVKKLKFVPVTEMQVKR